MGHAREQTKRLASKLRQIRIELNLSQDGIIRLLGLEDDLTREDISKFERGIREPPLRVIVRYARTLRISTDVLIDDDLNLPPL